MDRKLDLIPASTVAPRAVDWLWQGRIPLGLISLLAGVEGMGKGNVLAWIAARATRGELPGDRHGIPQNVAILSSEDGENDTLTPRLMAAGADLSRATFIRLRGEDGQASGLSLPADVGLLRDSCQANSISLVILDPINAFLDLRANSHNDHSIRGALGPIADAAMTGGFAVLAVMHLNKSDTVSERNALMGSVGYRAAARSTLIVGLDPDAPDAHGDDRVLVHGKHNHSRRQPGHRFRIVEKNVSVNPPINSTRIEMGEEVWFTVEDVLAAGQPDRKKPALDAAVEFLERELLGGPVPTKDVEKRALMQDISAATLKRARAKLGVTASRVGFQGPWHLELPELPPPAQSGSFCEEG